MCNFYSRYDGPTRLQASFKFVEATNMQPRYVVKPTSTEGVVAVGHDGQRHLVPMRWGLIPFWAKDMKTGLTMFNWRSEDVFTKPSYAGPFKKGRRCLVPVDAFFEFTGPKGQKQPHLFRPRDGRVMAFAGLWDAWHGPKDNPLSEPLLSYSIATTSPNATVAPIHDRMPVLFTREAEWDAWLSPDADPVELQKMLVPADDDLLETFVVSRDLLRIKQPGPEILAPVSA